MEVEEEMGYNELRQSDKEDDKGNDNDIEDEVEIEIVTKN